MSLWKPDQAKWIWVQGDDRPDNAYFQFRKGFALERLPSRAVVHVTADCKYLLFVNGEVAGRGPVTTNPAFKQVDEYDISPFLRAGDNAIGVLALQRHAKTSRLWPVRGGVLVQFGSDEISFGSDETWSARSAREYKRDVPYMTHQYGHQEWLDLRMAEAGWNGAGYDDRTWARAVAVQDAEKIWPEALVQRPVPPMRRIERRPARPVGYFGVYSKGIPAEQWYEPARQMQVDYITASVMATDLENLTAGSDSSTLFQENRCDGIGFVVDMGEEMLGYPFIEFECAEGVTVDLGHGELLSRNRIQTVILPESGAEQRYADRCVSRGGRQRWELFDTKGCRFLEVHFRGLPKEEDGTAKVIVHDIGVMESAWPEEETTDFRSSDELLNRIFGVCRRTVRVKHQDWFICDAQREQNRWPEFFQQWVYGQFYGRSDLVHHTLDQFVKGQMPSGMIPSTIPPIPEEGWNHDNNYMIATYGFPFAIWLDWLYGGDRPLHAEWLNCIGRIFDFLFSFADEDGMPRNTPGNHWVEWSAHDSRPSDISRPVAHEWRGAHLNGLLIIGLEKSAEMARSIGYPERAEDWMRKAKRRARRPESCSGTKHAAPSSTASMTAFRAIRSASPRMPC